VIFQTRITETQRTTKTYTNSTKAQTSGNAFAENLFWVDRMGGGEGGLCTCSVENNVF